MTYEQAIRNLNEAAYLAAKLAAKQDLASDAATLRRIALDTDQIVDGLSSARRDEQMVEAH